MAKDKEQDEKPCLSDKAVGFCEGYLVCQKTKRCVIRNDVYPAATLKL